MYGVVLWADERDSRAVIWCEDHGNLAFYSGAEHSAIEGLNLDAGDLIKFDLREHENMRVARNPMVVAGDYSEGLAQRLRDTAADQRDTRCEKKQTPRRDVRGGEVLSLADYREAKGRK